MAVKIAVFILVCIFALPVIAMAITASIAIIAFLLRVGLVLFVLWLIWTVFGAVWSKTR